MPPRTYKAASKCSNRRPVQKATVIKSANCGHAQKPSHIDDKILERIRKCLDRAHDLKSSELEAKAALFISHKLMTQHNVTQADLMGPDGKDKVSFGGQSTVRITRTDMSEKRVIMEAFTPKLAGAMCTFFDCKCYSAHDGDFVEWNFFGIASNTVAAAMSFEMAHNRILEWAGSYKGGTPTFSYRIGVADGLAAMAYRERQRELVLARRRELELVASQRHQMTGKEQLENRQSQLTPAQSSISVKDESLVPYIRTAALDIKLGDEEDNSDELGVKPDFGTDDIGMIDFCGDVDRGISLAATIDAFILEICIQQQI